LTDYGPRAQLAGCRLHRKTHLRPRPVPVPQFERPVQLFADKRADDRETGAALRLCDSTTVIRDGKQSASVPARELDPHLLATVLQRVLEELAEDECERGRAAPRQRDRLKACFDALPRAYPLHEPR